MNSSLKSHYLLWTDAIVELVPKNKYRPRNWGPWNNPMSALEEFYISNDRFISDTEIKKTTFSCNYKNYLKAIK